MSVRNAIRVWGAALVCASCVVGCAPERPSEKEKSHKASSSKVGSGEDGRARVPVAVVNGEEVSVGELERRIEGMAPYARVRFTTTEQRKELLSSVVVFEILADEAEKRGLKDDPAVVHEMKEAMVRRLLLEEEKKRTSPKDISDTDIKAYYQEHIAEYRTPAARRAAVIKVRTEELAASLHEELVQGKSEPDRQKRVNAFRRLSAKNSIEKALVTKGGDVGFLKPPDQLRQHREISRRVFELKEIGDFSEPYQHESVWHIVMMIDERTERVRSMESVSEEIRQILYKERRKAAREAFVSELEANAKVDINEENLAKIQPPRGDSQLLERTIEEGMPMRDLKKRAPSGKEEAPARDKSKEP